MPNAIFTCPALFLMLAFIAFPYGTNEPAVNAAIKIVKLYIHMHGQKFLKTLGGRPASRTSQFPSSCTCLHREIPVSVHIHPHTILAPSLGYPATQKEILLPTHNPSLCKRLPQNLNKISPSNQLLCYGDSGAWSTSSNRNTNCSCFSLGFLPPLFSKTFFWNTHFNSFFAFHIKHGDAFLFTVWLLKDEIRMLSTNLALHIELVSC